MLAFPFPYITNTLGWMTAEYQKYFESHREMTAPNEWLFVDERPAFWKLLSNVTPTFRRVSAAKQFVE